MLRAWAHLNHRQTALLAHAMRHPGATYTVEGHQNSHMTAYETARRDLLNLAAAGLLEQGKRGKARVFWPPADLRERIEARLTPAGAAGLEQPELYMVEPASAVKIKTP